MPLFDDLPGLFVDTFGEEAVIAVTPVDGVSRPLAGIFRAASTVISVDPDSEFMGDVPELHCAETDAVDLDKGAGVSVTPAGADAALLFTVATREPDGRGMVRFRLQEA